MKKVTVCIAIITLLLSCKSQQFTVDSLHGSFDGIEGGKKVLSTYILLELNQDSVCSLKKLLDLSKIECKGEWLILNNNLIEIKCNKNPVLSDVEKALQGGSFIEENIEIKILSKNKLKLDNVILRRKK